MRCLENNKNYKKSRCRLQRYKRYFNDKCIRKGKTCKKYKGRIHNTNVDKSIDLKSYIASAQKTNQKIIDNAGTQINAKTSEYMSTGKAFRGDSYEDL